MEIAEKCGACGADMPAWLGVPHKDCPADFVRKTHKKTGDPYRWVVTETPEPHTVEDYERLYLAGAGIYHKYPNWPET